MTFDTFLAIACKLKKRWFGNYLVGINEKN